MRLYADDAPTSSPGAGAPGDSPPTLHAFLHQFCASSPFSVRGRAYLAVVRYSCALGRLTGDYWTPPITAVELGRAFDRTSRHLSRIMLALADGGYIERRRVRLRRGGWGWEYRAIDITEPRASEGQGVLTWQ